MDPVRYRFVVDGELGPRYKAAFRGMTLECGNGRTEIVGMVVDQSQLQGIVERIGDLGLTLVSIAPDHNHRTD